MLSAALLAALMFAGSPSESAEPKRWANGSGAMAVGGTLKILSLGAGVTGIALGGSPGLVLTAWSTLPSALGGGLLVTGAWMRARHDGWYGEIDHSHRVRASKRVGWALLGTGAALLVGSGIGLALWPFGPSYDDGAPALYPKAFATVGALYVVAPLLIGAGSSAVTWSATYPRWRERKVVVRPTVGGLRLQF